MATCWRVEEQPIKPETMAKTQSAFPATEQIAARILVLRGEKVLLDVDLAALYGVSTKRFNEQIRRNLERFQSDFMFQLTNQELAILRSQFATSSSASAWVGGVMRLMRSPSTVRSWPPLW